MDGLKYYGGVEGGATHSNLVICDQRGKVVGRATGSHTNHWVVGIEECVNRILVMLHQAKAEAGIPDDRPLDSLGLTLSGCEQDSTNAELAAQVKEREGSAHAVYVASDTAGSLFTGAPNGGMVVIAGTGSNALLRTEEGKQYGCGGWGFLLGDEGGAYWIAYKAIKSVFDDVDGLSPAPHCADRVWETVREHFGAETRADLLPHVYKHFDKSKFAGLTAKLAQVASEGDALGQRLFADAGAALAAHIVALIKRSTATKLRVVCVGSVWKSWHLLMHGLLRKLEENNVKTQLEFVRLRVTSALGAAWLGAKHVDYDLPRDDSAYCEVFHTYQPSDKCNGNINGVTIRQNNVIYNNGS